MSTRADTSRTGVSAGAKLALILPVLSLTTILTSCAIPGQCSRPFVSDVETTGLGHEDPETAIEAWIQEDWRWVSSDGWEFTQTEPGVMQATHDGGWEVGIVQTAQGGWLVSGLGCV